VRAQALGGLLASLTLRCGRRKRELPTTTTPECTAAWRLCRRHLNSICRALSRFILVARLRYAAGACRVPPPSLRSGRGLHGRFFARHGRRRRRPSRSPSLRRRTAACATVIDYHCGNAWLIDQFFFRYILPVTLRSFCNVLSDFNGVRSGSWFYTHTVPAWSVGAGVRTRPPFRLRFTQFVFPLMRVSTRHSRATHGPPVRLATLASLRACRSP